MIYDVTLRLTNDYGAPSDHARSVLRVLPSDIAGVQTVFRRALHIAPAAGERREGHDFFGNATATLSFHRPISHLDVTLQARVERHAKVASLDLSPGLGGLAAELDGLRNLAPASALHFRGPSPRVGLTPDIAGFARDHVEGAMTALEVVDALGRAIHAEMRFDAEATDVQTPPEEAFAARHGVCQDFSHIMISGLRSLNIPAAYVSGFLRTLPPPGQARLEGADAMHAWVSAWCGSETGWVDYDPTNACAVSADHITVARGRDYSDVAPIKGALRTSGAQSGSHSVDVVPLEDVGDVARWAGRGTAVSDR